MRKFILSALAVVFVLIAVIPAVYADQISSFTPTDPITVKFINIDEFRASYYKITAIDVRSQRSRTNSMLGLPDEVWIDPKNDAALNSFIKSADKNAAYVVFCSCSDDGYAIKAAEFLISKNFQDIAVLKGGWKAILASDIRTIPLSY